MRKPTGNLQEKATPLTGLDPSKSSPTVSYVPVSFTRTTTQMSTGTTDAADDGRPRRADDVSLLARFVRHISAIFPRLSAAGLSQMRSRRALQSYGRTRRRGRLSTSTTDTLVAATIKNYTVAGSLPPSKEKSQHFVKARRYESLG